MKRVGNLWERLVTFPNLLRASCKARKGKRDRRDVAAFEYDAERELHRIRAAMQAGAYPFGPYHTFTITEPKPRLISAAPYRDRVVHHALCNVLEPVYERTFISDTYACRKDKGTHAAVRRCHAFARCFPWVLKADIRKFFPSIDHTVLKVQLVRKIKDRRVLDLAGRIIDHSNEQEPVIEHFPGDHLFTYDERRHGLPVWWGGTPCGFPPGPPSWVATRRASSSGTCTWTRSTTS
jgi:retron-type reverse transcriptase